MSQDVFSEGQKVLVYLHGEPRKAAVGTVRVISTNQRSIAVAFDHLPPFAFDNDVVGIHPEHGAMFLAFRQKAGPWIEMMSMGHYEIESVEPA
jgi:hypothetical protein